MEMNCSVCGAPLDNGQPHCSKCKAEMTCESGTCTCPSCGNTAKVEEIKCDECLVA